MVIGRRSLITRAAEVEGVTSGSAEPVLNIIPESQVRRGRQWW
jgi:hypothetical protein